MILGGRTGDAAREVDEKPEHELAHRRDEPRARPRDEHARAARGGDVDRADVHRAAQERDELRAFLENERFPGGLEVRHDDVAALRGGDERFARERTLVPVQPDLALLPQARQSPLPVIVAEHLRRVSEEDP